MWQSGVRFFPWYATRTSLSSAPPSPTRQWKSMRLGTALPQQPQSTRQATFHVPPRTAKDRVTHEPMGQLSPEPASLYPTALKSSLLRVSPPTAIAPAVVSHWSQQVSPSTTSPHSSSPSSSPGSSPSTRPRHPRTGSSGSPGRQRPPPLDLTRTTAYRDM